MQGKKLIIAAGTMFITFIIGGIAGIQVNNYLHNKPKNAKPVKNIVQKSSNNQSNQNNQVNNNNQTNQTNNNNQSNQADNTEDAYQQALDYYQKANNAFNYYHYNKAAYYYKKACKLGNIDACIYGARNLYNTYINVIQLEAARIAKYGCETYNNGVDCYDLFYMYLHGIPGIFPANVYTAVRYGEKACEFKYKDGCADFAYFLKYHDWDYQGVYTYMVDACNLGDAYSCDSAGYLAAKLGNDDTTILNYFKRACKLDSTYCFDYKEIKQAMQQ